MEVKVWKREGAATVIESHSIPPLVGDTATTEHPDGSTVTSAGTDQVADVVETAEVGEGVGVLISREVMAVDGRGAASADPAKGIAPQVVVAPSDLGDPVFRVDVDGERVWPEEDGDEVGADAAAGPVPEDDGMEAALEGAPDDLAAMGDAYERLLAASPWR